MTFWDNCLEYNIYCYYRHHFRVQLILHRSRLYDAHYKWSLVLFRIHHLVAAYSYLMRQPRMVFTCSRQMMVDSGITFLWVDIILWLQTSWMVCLLRSVLCEDFVFAKGDRFIQRAHHFLIGMVMNFSFRVFTFFLPRSLLPNRKKKNDKPSNGPSMSNAYRICVHRIARPQRPRFSPV